MDQTLRMILVELYQSHATIDQLRARVQELEQLVERSTQAEERLELAAMWSGPKEGGA